MQGNQAAAAMTTATTTSTRANGARTVIRKASERVADRITLQSIEQSFPDFVETDGAFIKQLQESTLDHLNSGFAAAWEDLFTNSELAHFTDRANAADQVFAAASNRRARREVPQDAWLKGADPILAIQAAVVPKLQANLQAIKQIKGELTDDSEARIQKILAAQAEADALEGEINAILSSIKQGHSNLESIDMEAVQELFDTIIPLLDADKL